jgi:glucosylceramidase
MKYPQACNYGRLVQTEENLRAYALYLRKFVEEYAKEGIKISHLYPQNEFLCDHKFPSCQ